MKARLISWILRLTAALILMQTLYFKFTAHPESVAIFTQLGLEPQGRIFIGAAELLTAILLLIPRSLPVGALMGICLMAGALMSHLTQLGFAGDLFTLAILAVVVLACCLILLFLHREQYRKLLHFRKKTE